MLRLPRPALWVVAGVLTGAYLLLLFGGDHLARVRLIEVNEQKTRQDVNRTARALRMYFAERGKDLMTLRRLPAIDAFFANRALGMSLQYGLMASLLQVHNRLRNTRDSLRLTREDPSLEGRLFHYFALVDNEGVVLADSGGALPAHSIPSNWTPPALPVEPNTPHWLVTDDAKLLVSVPVYFKEKRVATLIADLALAPIYGQVLSGSQPNPDRFDFLQQTGGTFLTPPGETPAQRQAISEYARLRANADDRTGAQSGDHVLIEVALPIAGLNLASVVDFSHIRESTSAPLPLAIASTLPLALFTVMVALNRSERARREAEKVSAENIDLERLVEVRTKDLEIAAKEAQRANQAKSEFLANMSHELRTPMHAVLSFAQLGAKRTIGSDQAKLHDYFNKIIASGDRLLALLNDLLDISKLEAGRMAYAFKATNFTILLESARHELEALMAHRGLTLELELLSNLPIVLDEMRIGQVIRNLLANAVKFTADNSYIEVQARLLTRDAREVLELRVADQGPGIPESELDTIFDKFIQSSRTANRAGGTGLGLAICKEIVTQHHGHIWAENRAAGGACFVVELPTRGPEPRTQEPLGLPAASGANQEPLPADDAAPLPARRVASS